jgi:DNA-binding MarR family transcriptional regulator
LIDALIEQHLQAQHELMGSLTSDEREQVNQALKLLLPQYE